MIKRRINEEQAAELGQDFLDIGIETTSTPDLWLVSLQLAFQLNRSLYDAAYVALAEHHGVDLITGDKRLFNAVKEKKPFVRYIADWTPPQAKALASGADA